MSNISDSIGSLSPQEKRLLLAKKLQAKASQVVATYPLSYGQQALWFLYRSAPKTAAYNVAFTARIRSFVDVKALRRALQRAIARHATLRSNFTLQNGKPVQEVRGYREVGFQVTDASSLTETELRERVVTAYRQPFVLERDPLMRVDLFTRSERNHVLLLTLHHIVCDGWSVWLLLDELRVLYEAETQGTKANLTPLATSYADYIRWQGKMLAGTEGKWLWNYWQQQLGGELPLLNLPTDRPRPAVQTYNGASHSFALSCELSQSLKELAQAQRVTLYTVLLAAFQILLHRYTGQEDILVGSPTAGRSRLEFAPLVGNFINPVVLRAKVDDRATFETFLARVRQTVLEAIAHQDYPFSLLVEQLQPKRDSSRSPLFQVSFVLQKPQQFGEAVELLAGGNTGARVNWGGLSLEPFAMVQQEGQLDLTLETIATQESLLGVFKYNCDLFEAETISRMTEHFQNLLQGIATSPQQKIGDLPLLSEAERHQLLVSWNDTQRDYPLEKCLHQLFEEQVERNPNAIAVRFEGQQLTYRELNHRANQLAHYLQELGVEPEILVGICLNRSLEMVVGLLAILKAGGAYIPLDPAYPQERLAFMLADAAVSVLLTQEQLLTRLPQHQAHTICLDRDWELISHRSRENPRSTVESENLAYTIYTSGSTGKPKGAMNTHLGIVNRLLWMQERYQLTGDDKPNGMASLRILQKTPFSFDVSVWEFFWPLITGATLVIAQPGGHQDSDYLVETIAKEKISVVHFVPSMLRVFLEARNLETCSCLRQVICSGEAFPYELQERFFAKLDAQLDNLYGPTEAAIDVTCWRCLPKSSLGKVPIGRPIANTQIYILDSRLRPVPIGVPGELHIGGVGLARGYLNRPELTAAKFIANPHVETFRGTSLLYKTGDLARYLPALKGTPSDLSSNGDNGNIEYLGRLDNQVKIRGFRIELGEIEAVLTQHSAVSEAVVIPRQDAVGDRLVAYLVGEKELLTKSELRHFLKEQLPDYMVPSAFVVLEALPLTPNGKIDRLALSALEISETNSTANSIAPRTHTEKILAAIWKDILGVEVGINDNFFEAGGHSLLATQLFSKVRHAFSVELPMSCLFESPTVVELAQLIEAAQQQNSSAIESASVFLDNLDAEAVLDPTIVPNATANQKPKAKPAAILLTGATGFLGAFLLQELLQQTQAEIYCLVRAADARSGREKILSNLKRYQIEDESIFKRVTPIAGDLTAPLLGIAREEFQQLSAQIDVIYHNGALVNFTYPYAKLKAANVLGTQEVLRLASQTKLKSLHYISTVSVFDSVDYIHNPEKIRIEEPDRLPTSEKVYGGYAQSKWVAEHLVTIAGDRGLPVSIYRPGTITGHSKTGAWNTNDAVCRMLRGVIQLAKSPDLDISVNLVPVDYVAKTLVYLSQHCPTKQVFHLVNPRSLSASHLVDLIRDRGYPVEQISYSQWQSELVRLSPTAESNPLYSLLPTFFEEIVERVTLFETFKYKPKFDCQNTLEALKNTNIICPAIEELLETYLSYLNRQSLLKEP